MVATAPAGGRLPSGLFGANAAWWAITVLAYNLNAMMKRLVLGGDWAARRMKAMRFHLIALWGLSCPRFLWTAICQRGDRGDEGHEMRNRRH